MDILLLLGLAAAFAWMWNRMDTLERRIAHLEQTGSIPDSAAPEPVRVSRPQLRESDPPPRAVMPPIAAREEAPASPDVATAQTAPPAPADDTDTHRDTAPEHPPLSQLTQFLPRLNFEDVFGRLLPIWGGGIALAIAGFFLVRWSIDEGLLTRTVRTAMGFCFGTALIGAAELAFRFEARVRDTRIRQALAGAGLATLYASFYLAGSQYGLIGPTLCFAGLASVTALAIGLSFRFGLPSAVLGLIGGFVAPALAGGTEPNIPLLATYLALVTGGLTMTGHRQRYPLLGLAALAAGLLWGVVLLVAGPVDNLAILAIGSYLLLIGTLLPAMLGSGPLGTTGRIAAAGIAVLQIASLVDRSGFSPLAWGTYLLIGAAITILGIRFKPLRDARGIAAALSVCLIAIWPDAPGGWLAAIASANAVIFAGLPMLHLRRGDTNRVDWAQIAAYPVALTLALCIQRGVSLIGGPALPIAAGAACLTLLPAAAAWMSRSRKGDDIAPGPFAAFASAIVMLALTALLATPAWVAPLVPALLALAVARMLRDRAGMLPDSLRWGIGLAGVGLLLTTTRWHEFNLLFGDGAVPEWRFALRWLAATVPFVLMLLVGDRVRRKGTAETFAALLGYGTAAMLIPGPWLAMALALAAIALAWRMPEYGKAILTLLVLGLGWAHDSLMTWISGGLNAAAGQPLLLGDLPSLSETLRTMAPVAAALGAAAMLNKAIFARHRYLVMSMAAAVCMIVVHICYKQLFGITDLARFAEAGLAERTMWQALLGAAALGIARLSAGRRVADRLGTAVAIAALCHFAWFSLILHNPLWSEQAVGSLPVLNWLLPAYGIAIALLFRTIRQSPIGNDRVYVARDAVAMALMTLLAVSELRQFFSGTMLSAPVGEAEDLLRSLAAIALSLGFLGWGARTEQRSWRIGSLVLMLLAVLKVFLFDAAGLEGLARIGSFFALGICLIGIGWFYSRQLIGDRAKTEKAGGAPEPADT